MGAGTVLTTSGNIEYEMISPNINAPDVKDDGRAMLLKVASGVGFPEMIFTADYSQGNYSSSMVAQNPFVKEIEDWQDFFETYYNEFFARVVEASIKYGKPKLPKGTDLTCTIVWPSLITADIKVNNEAKEKQFRNKTLSRRTWMESEGLDYDVELENMRQEEEEELFDDPFNMPGGPQNQFSQFSSGEEDDLSEEVLGDFINKIIEDKKSLGETIKELEKENEKLKDGTESSA
jgi:hypothetical protein